MDVIEKLKAGIKFEHYTYPYDPELESILSLQRETKAELEEMILSHFEPFWLEATGPKQTAAFGFYFRDTRIHVQHQNYNMPGLLFVEWRSKKLIEENAGIDTDFLPHNFDDLPDYSRGVSLEEMLEKASREGKLFVPDFQDKMPELSVDNFTPLLHFTSDPKITKLLVVLNKLKIYTLDSCEGHDSALTLRKFPHVGFPNVMIFMLLSSLRDWPEKNNRKITIRSFTAPAEGSGHEMFNLFFEDDGLARNQELVASLADYLEEKIASLLRGSQ